MLRGFYGCRRANSGRLRARETPHPRNSGGLGEPGRAGGHAHVRRSRRSVGGGLGHAHAHAQTSEAPSLPPSTKTRVAHARCVLAAAASGRFCGGRAFLGCLPCTESVSDSRPPRSRGPKEQNKIKINLKLVCPAKSPKACPVPPSLFEVRGLTWASSPVFARPQLLLPRSRPVASRGS